MLESNLSLKMEQPVTEIHQDAEQRWLAGLACGHDRMYDTIHHGQPDRGPCPRKLVQYS